MSTIDELTIYWCFGKHRLDPEAHVYLNAIYARDLFPIDALYEDTTRTTLKSNAWQEMFHIIVDVIENEAFRTTDTRRIMTVLTACTFRFFLQWKTKVRFSLPNHYPPSHCH